MKDSSHHVYLFQRALYGSLFILLGLSITLLVLKITDTAASAWTIFFKIYLILAILHTWYIFLLLFIGDIRKRKYEQYQGGSIAVIIPVYNEEPRLLKATLDSVIAAEGNKEIIVVDDGSREEGVRETLLAYVDSPQVKIYSFDKNKGKRRVLHTAISTLVERHDYVITIDSDTVLKKDALIRLVEPLQNNNIGAVTGDIRLLNEQTNRLTQMTGAYYWSALHIHRKAQSTLGMVSCCSGALAAYKSKLVRSIIDEFIDEEFLGEKCTFSDDRHLTNLILKQGYDVVFQPDAIAYTYTPETYRKFIKQQLRWRRGFIQEALYALTFTYKKKPILFFEILLWELVLPNLALSILILVILNCILNPGFFFLSVLPSLFVLLTITHLPLIFYAPRKIVGLIYYTFFSYFVMYWVGLYALFTVNRRGWSTR